MRTDGVRRGIGDALTLADVADLARDLVDGRVWDFVEGGAGQERTLAENTAAFDRLRLLPRVLTGAGLPETGTRILGRDWRLPLAVAPIAYHTLVHPEGEAATAAAAGSAGVPLVLSTFAGRRFDQVAAAADGPLWLQVYCFRDRDVTRGLIERAADAGIEALVLTADAPRLGRRLRDLRNDFRLPAGIVPANLPGGGPGGVSGGGSDYSSPSGHASTEFDPCLDWSIVDWLRSVSPLPILVKGILTGADAQRAVEVGADGVIVSNHGGRQLDAVPAALEALPDVARALRRRCALLVDGGIRRGTDILLCLALGADAVLVGRPVLHGLAVDGEKGVARVLRILKEELVDAIRRCPASLSFAYCSVVSPSRCAAVGAGEDERRDARNAPRWRRCPAEAPALRAPPACEDPHAAAHRLPCLRRNGPRHARWQGQAPCASIRPAGKGAPLVDPKPILNKWESC